MIEKAKISKAQPMKHDRFVDLLRYTGISRSYKRQNITTYHIPISKTEKLWKLLESLDINSHLQWTMAEDFEYQFDRQHDEVIVRAKSLDPNRLY